MGGVWGIFEPRDSLMFPLYDFFRLVQEYFLGFLGVRDFFSFNFPLHEYFFVLRPLRLPPPPPTYTISNGPSLTIDTWHRPIKELRYK